MGRACLCLNERQGSILVTSIFPSGFQGEKLPKAKINVKGV